MPVTDEALTQCIKTLRRQLGDDAAQPALYRNRAQAWLSLHRPGRSGAAMPLRTDRPSRRRLAPARCCSAAPGRRRRPCGLLGGLFYGFAGASQPLQPGMGAISILLVLLCLTIARRTDRRRRGRFRDRRGRFARARALAHRRRSAWRVAGWRDRQAARHRRVQPAVRPLARRHHRRPSKALCSAPRSGWARWLATRAGLAQAADVARRACRRRRAAWLISLSAGG